MHADSNRAISCWYATAMIIANSNSGMMSAPQAYQLTIAASATESTMSPSSVISRSNSSSARRSRT
jgi:hypothetical protein